MNGTNIFEESMNELREKFRIKKAMLKSLQAEAEYEAQN